MQKYSQYVWAGDGTSMSGVYGWKPAGNGSCRTLRALHVSVSQPGAASLTQCEPVEVDDDYEIFGRQRIDNMTRVFVR